MNKYTLSFTSQTQEEQYLEYMSQEHIPIFVKTLYIYIFGIGIPFTIISFIEGNLPNGIIGIVIVITCSAFIQIVKWFQNHFNKFVSLINILITTLIAGQVYFLEGNMLKADPKIVLFYGMTITQIQYVGYFLNQNFLFLNSIFNAMTWNPEYLQVRWAYFCSSMLILFFLYEQIKIKKKAFLMSQGEKEWAHIVRNGLSSSIMTVKYNQKENFIGLDIINSIAQNKFSVRTADDFKSFSRQVLVFNKDTSYDQVIEQEQFPTTERKILLEKNSLNSGQASPSSNYEAHQSLQQSQGQTLTLENQIIFLIKQQILNDKISPNITDRRLSVSWNAKKVVSNPIELKLRRQSIFQKQQPIIHSFNGIYFSQGERKVQQKFIVKISVFQQQSQYRSCIVFEEENHEQKIKKLQQWNLKIQSNFMQLYLGLWMKLKAILDNSTNQNLIKSYIKLAYNQINNVRSHTYTLKKQSLFTKGDGNKETNIKEIIESITTTFYQFRDSIQFTFQNCNNQSIIYSNIPRICQVLNNFIENSLKQSYQNVYLKDNGMNDEYSMYNQNTYGNDNMFKDYKCGPSLFFQNNRQDLSYSECPESKQVIQIGELSTRRNSKQLDYSVSPRIKRNKVRVKFQLIEGENPLSNVIKVTIKDQCEVSKSANLEQLLHQIGNMHFQTTEAYKEYKHLGWKVSLNIIGKLGPFFNMFVSPNFSKGMNLHFYLYQNQNILDENQKDIQFRNRAFEIDYKQSQQRCFNTCKRQIMLENESQTALSFSCLPFQILPEKQEFKLNDPNDISSTLPCIVIDEQTSPIQNCYLYDKFQLNTISTKDYKS